MADLDYAIVAPTGDVLLRSNTRSAIERLADAFDGTPSRYVFGTWQPLVSADDLAEAKRKARVALRLAVIDLWEANQSPLALNRVTYQKAD